MFLLQVLQCLWVGMCHSFSSKVLKRLLVFTSGYGGTTLDIALLMILPYPLSHRTLVGILEEFQTIGKE